MIWLVYILMALGAALFLAPAFFDAPETADGEVESYLSQIDALQADESLDAATRDAATLALQRRVLARREGAAASPARVLGAVVLGGLVVAGGALYALSGTPDYRAQVETPDTGLGGILEQLEARLATDRADDPVGWQLYGRSLQSLGRYEEAQVALERAASLSGDPDMVREAEAAARLAANPPGPTQDDINAAQAMSEEDRAAMIAGMVDSLAARLEDAPDDPGGWARLIRARGVLEQSEQQAQDIARMRAVYAGDPDTTARILAAAGVAAGEAEPR